jgi:hypothetical protein
MQERSHSQPILNFLLIVLLHLLPNMHLIKQLCNRLYDTSAIMQLAAMDLANTSSGSSHTSSGSSQELQTTSYPSESIGLD